MRAKLWDRERLAEHLRTDERRVVTTNGCFDLLHVGHLRTLQTARAFGDALVVALNSDASVKRLKGKHRPLVEQAERAELLAGLECVDYVIIFEEDTPIETIECLRPAVHVKGGDYRVEDLPEAAHVQKHGGRVEIVPLVPGRSSSRLEALLHATSGNRQ